MVAASAGIYRDRELRNLKTPTPPLGKVAAALGADKVIFFYLNVRGGREPHDPGLGVRLRRRERRWRWRSGEIEGGMRPKLGACIEAIGGGVQSSRIIDGSSPHSLLLELFTDAGIGTM